MLISGAGILEQTPGRDRDIAFICADCMGYSAAMKHAIEEETGHSVRLPRTLAVKIISGFPA